MDIHKPKPIHNWRELLKEVGIIVLGVSIALAAEQMVEWVHWRNQVAEARTIIASEMARNIAYGTERLRSARCLEVRIRAIGDILDMAVKSGALPPLGRVDGPTIRPWSNGAWESVVASQTATHFPRQQLAALSLIYKQVERVENWNRQESEVWSTLSTIIGAGRRFDPSYDAELRKALGIALSNNFAISISSMLLIQNAQSQDLPFTPDERQMMANALKQPDYSFLCAPISAAADKNQNGLVNGLSNARLQQLDALLKQLGGEAP